MSHRSFELTQAVTKNNHYGDGVAYDDINDHGNGAAGDEVNDIGDGATGYDNDSDDDDNNTSSMATTSVHWRRRPRHSQL